MTYKAIGWSVTNYGAPVWSTNASATSIGKIQIAQNEALRIATGSHKMPSIDHLHNETEMLTVKQHSDLRLKRPGMNTYTERGKQQQKYNPKL